MEVRALKALLYMDFLVLFGFVFLSAALALLMYLASFILRYKSPVKTLDSTYECGIQPVNDAKIQFSPRFFAYAVCFILFEAECVLMFPFAYLAKNLDLFCIVEIMIFVLLLIFSLLFGIKSGLFELD